MRCYLLPFVVLVCIAASANGEEWYSDSAFRPPDPSGDASLDSPAKSDAAYYLSSVTVTHTFDNMAGLNDALKSCTPDAGLFQVAQGYAVEMDSASLFPAPLTVCQATTNCDEGGYRVYLAAVRSVDAHALRLLVDLSGLRPDEELWVMDPTAPRSFGPYTRQDDVEGGRWLPTVFGDTAVLSIRVRDQGLPTFRLLGVSHFFWELAEAKELSCNINIACDEDPIVQQVSTGIGLVLVQNGLDTFAGSGALLNTPATPEFEPYFITAHHVVSDRETALNTDVIWDFRSSRCTTNDAPSPATLPHSNTKAMLATSATLDATLLELDSVTPGRYGRMYLGWDTRTPNLSEEVIVIHHPAAKHMRITYGRVQAVDETVLSFMHETRVGWYDGVTEAGSSGACLLYADGTYRIAGTLTGGSNQTCNFDPQENWDYFSSFTEFYKDISPAYLRGNAGPGYIEPGEGEGEGEAEGEGEGEPVPDCTGAAMGGSSSTRFPGGSAGNPLIFAIVIVAFILRGRRPAPSRCSRGSDETLRRQR